MTHYIADEGLYLVDANVISYKCDAFCNLVPFVQFKNREKHPWRALLLAKLLATKSITPPRVFFTFVKLCKWYKIAQNITNDTKVSMHVRL